MATYYFRNTGDINWGLATNWSLSSGGPADGAIPTATDDVIFDANSGNCEVNSISRLAKTLTFTSYGNTITMTNGITVSGNVTLGASMGIAGSGSLTVDADSTLTSNGKQWNRPLLLATPGAAKTFTIVGDWYVTNLRCGTGGTASNVLNSTASAKIYVSGNLDKAGTAPSMSGNTEIVLNGNGTWSNPTGNPSAQFGNPVTIDSPGGSITISNNVNFASVGGTGVLKYLNGTVTCSGTFLATSATLDTNDSIPFSTMQLGNAVTLTSNTATTNLTFNPGPGNTTINGFRINISGNLTGTNATVGGTTKFIMTGTGTWSNSGTGFIGNDLEFNTTGTVSVTGNVYWGNTGRTLTYIPNSGTVNFGTSTLQLRNANLSIDLGSLSVWNLTVPTGTVTYTLLSNLNVGGLFTVDNAVISLNGTFNINVSGGLFMNGTSNAILKRGTGNTSLYLLGGAWSQNNSGVVGIDTYINGNITIGSGVNMSVEFGVDTLVTTTLQHLSGTVTTTGSTIRFRNANLSTSAITWNNVLFSASYTCTLVQNLNINGVLSNNGNTIVNGAYTINAAGGLSLSGGYFLSTISSTVLNLTGGTWSASTSSAELAMTTQINGNVTILNNVYYRSWTLSWNGVGTVTTTSSTLWLVGSAATVNSNGLQWNNVTLAGGTPTFTLASNMRINGLLTITPSGSPTLTGAFAYECYGGVTQTISTVTGGTSQIDLYGGVYNMPSSSVICRNRVNIRGTSSFTGTVSFLDIRHFAGTVTTSGCTLNIPSNLYIETAAVTWTNVTVGNAIGITLGANFNIGGLFTVPNNITFSGNFNVNCSGGLTLGGNISQVAGTTTIMNLISGTCAGGAGTLSLNTNLGGGSLTLAGTIKYNTNTLAYTGSGTVNAGTSTLDLTGTCTLNTSTLLWNNIAFSVTSTVTLQSDLRATGNVSQSGGNLTLNATSGVKLYIGGNLTLGTTTNVFGGSAEVVMNGTGTLSTLAGITLGRLQSNLTIDTVGAISISGLFPFAAATFKHLNGTFTAGTSTLWISYGAAATPTVLDLGGITIANLRIDTSPSHTITLQSNLNLSGNFLLNSGSVTINGNTLAVGGNLTLNAATTNTVGGSTVILLNGTGTWSTSAQNVINTDLTINTTGTVSISGTVRYGTKTLLYVPNTGSVNVGSSTLSLESTCNINVAGITWWDFSFGGGGNTTTNITGDLNIGNNLLTGGGNVSKTLNGSGNINVSGGLVPGYRSSLVKGTGAGYTLRMIGTGSILDSEISGTGGSSSHYTLSGIPLVIDTLGTITFGTNGFKVNPYFGIYNANITHINGTVTVVPGHYFDVQATVTLDVKGITTPTTSLTNAAGINFNNFRVLGGTITLTSPICIIGTHFNNTVTTINGSTVYNNGSLNLAASALSGSTTYRFTGTGSWSGSGYLNFTNVVIDTVGSFAVTGSVYRSTGTLTYVPNTGTVTTTGSTLFMMGSATLDTNTLVWANAQLGNGSHTITFTSDFIASGNVSKVSSNNAWNGVGRTIYVGGNLSSTNTSAAGTANVVLNGTGTWSGYFSNNIEINSPSGTITFGPITSVNQKTFRWTAGTVNASTSTFSAISGNFVGLGNNVQFYNLYHTGNNLITDTDIYVTQNFDQVQNIAVVSLTPTTMYIGGSYSLNGLQVNAPAGYSLTTFEMNGTGTLSRGASARFISPIRFNSPSGVITVTGFIPIANCTITHVPGSTAPVTTGSTLSLSGSCTLNTSGMTWDTVGIGLDAGAGTSSTTLQSTLNANVLETFFGSNTLAQNMILTGSGGFTVNTFRNSSSSVVLGSVNRQITFQEGVTYTVNNSLSFPMTNTVGRLSFVSSSVTNRAIFTLNPSATQSMSYVNGTRMDSSLGKTIYSQNAVLTNTLNWSIYDPSMTGNFLLLFN